jgi:NADPH2:quinone reductase
MHAIRLHAFGPPENLRYEQVADPTPGPGQARIAVAAAGVHLIDTALRAGRAMGPHAAVEARTTLGKTVLVP